MWPWEHAAAGYLLYSLSLRALGRKPPTDRAAWVLLLATQLPDLLDKTLSWGLDAFPTGYAIGHSVFVAVPVGLLAVTLAARRNVTRLGVAVTVGYWSHLVADVLIPVRRGEAPIVDRVLWPVAVETPYESEYGLRRGLVYLGRFLSEVASMDVSTAILLYLLLPLATVVLWLLDSAPGLAPVASTVAGLRRR